MSEEHILVVGFGSVGMRHANNLCRHGCRVSVVDTRRDRLNRSDIGFGVVKKYLTLVEALDESLIFSGVVIATPTKYHVPQTLMVAKHGLPVLVEKPLAINLQEAKELSQYFAGRSEKGALIVGYTWRWNRSLKEFRKYIIQGRIGRVLRARFTMSAHLADWHPWEPYQEYFMASRELGGGALLDESHWIDQMIYLFDVPDSVYALVDKVSSLEIDSDDTVDIVATYHSGLIASIHLDLYTRPHEKEIKVYGDKGTITWQDNVDSSMLTISGDSVQSLSFDEPRNVMFEEEMIDFLRVIRRDPPRQICGLSAGYKVMRVIEAARASAQGREVVNLERIE